MGLQAIVLFKLGITDHVCAILLDWVENSRVFIVEAHQLGAKVGMKEVKNKDRGEASLCFPYVAVDIDQWPML